MKKELIETAFHLGQAAFSNDIKSAPCWDKRMMAMLAGLKLKIGEGGTDLMAAWSRGWHKANLQSNN